MAVPFPQLVKAKIEEACALPVDDGNAKRGLRAEQRRQRLQLKTRLEIYMRGTKTRWKFVFLPEILSGAGKDGFALGVAAEVRGEIQDAIEIGMERSVLVFGGGALQRLFHDIFGDDRLAAMRAILRRLGLKIKTQGTRTFAFVRLKSRQLTDFVPRHHSRSFGIGLCCEP